MADENTVSRTKESGRSVFPWTITCGDWMSALVICVLSVGLTAPLMSGWHMGHDGLRIHYLLEHFRAAVADGSIYPRYLPNANGGYGYPLFLFYPPGFFYAALPIALATGNIAIAIYATITLLFAQGGYGAYKICRELARPGTALFGATMFLITPYVYVDLHVRNAISELTALLLCPWVFFWLFRLYHMRGSGGQWRRVVGLGISIWAVMISHPTTTLLLLPALCLLSLLLCAGSVREKAADLTSVAIALGIAGILGMPYWVTLFQMKAYVAHEGAIAGYYTAVDHVVYWSQLIDPTWGYGYSFRGTDDDDMSFQLGLPHLLMAIAGIGVGWSDRRVRAVGIVYTILIVLMTGVASALWSNVSILQFVQFPWRMLSVIATIQVACIVGIERVVSLLRPWAAKCVLLLIVVWTTAWHLEQFFPRTGMEANVQERVVSHAGTYFEEFHRYSHMEEYLPKTSTDLQNTVEPRGDGRAIMEVTARRRITFLRAHSVHRISCRISSGTEAELIVNQVYIPGWRVELNGNRVSREELEDLLLPDGRIRVKLDDREQVVRAFYDGPPGRRLRNAVMAIAGLFVVALLRKLKVKKRSL